MSLNRKSRTIIALAVVGALVLSGGFAFAYYSTGQSSDKMQVVATFYPLYYFSSEIGKDKADVSMLIPDNAEPHSWEPRPSDVVKVDKADILVYNGAGFEPWMDEFLELTTKKEVVVVDTSKNVSLMEGHDHEEGEEHDHEEEEHDHGPNDPHFWLDPRSAKVQVDNILAAFVEADPDNADFYEANAEDLKSRLDALDQEFADGLADRTKDDIVTTHEGFNYLAARYGFNVHSVMGIYADTGDITPEAMAELEDLINDLGIGYIFGEPTYSDTTIESLAHDTGAEVLILDGIHGRSGPHADMDYFEIMRANLQALRTGLGVST